MVPGNALSRGAEDHLKTVFALQLQVPDGPPTVRAVARALGITPSSVSETVQRLRRDGFVASPDRPGIALTDAGRTCALAILRRHRLVETFLHHVLGFDLHELHEEADRIEHVLGDRVVDRLDAFLGHPARDPHGDPIPRQGQPHEERWPPSLDTAPEGSRFVVERVDDHDGAVLARLVSEGVVPGTQLDVGADDPFGGGRAITVGDRRFTLAPALVAAVYGVVDETSVTGHDDEREAHDAG